jgi:hypothetical protein
LVVPVTVFLPGTVVDEEGNEKTDERATAVPLEGWDIQPVPLTSPPQFPRSQLVQVPDLYRAHVPMSHATYLAEGRVVKNEKTKKTYRMGRPQDWGTHFVVILEGSN